MPRTDDLPYFALTAPLSDEHIFTILGRVIPLNQLQKPLGGKMRPLPPSRSSRAAVNESGSGLLKTGREIPRPNMTGSSETEDENPQPSGSENRLETVVADAGSATTEVGSIKSGNEGDIEHKVDPVSKKFQEGVDLLKLDPDLYPAKAVVCRNLNILKRKTIGIKAKGVVEDMLKLYAQHGKDDQVNVSANGFRRIEIPNPQDRISVLLRHDEYAEPIIQLLRDQESKKAAVIISILTCSDLTRTQRSLETWGLGGELRNPGVQEGNMAPTVAAEGEGTVTTYEELSGTYEGEVIMACSYLKLQLRAAPPEQQGIWYKITQAIRRVLHKPPKKSDRIEVSPNSLDPAEGSLFLPSEPIKGTIPVLFGDPFAARQEHEEEEYNTTGKDYLAFTIYA